MLFSLLENQIFVVFYFFLMSQTVDHCLIPKDRLKLITYGSSIWSREILGKLTKNFDFKNN